MIRKDAGYCKKDIDYQNGESIKIILITESESVPLHEYPSTLNITLNR